MNTKFLNDLKIDLSTTTGLKNPTPNNNSILTKEQVDAAIVANNPTTVNYLIKDGIYASGVTPSSALGISQYNVGDGVMAFDDLTVNSVLFSKYKIYRCLTAGSLSTAVFAEIPLLEKTTITSNSNIEYPGNISIVLIGGYVYSYNSSLSNFAVWEEGDLILNSAIITSEVEVDMSIAGIYNFPTIFPAGSKPMLLEIYFKNAVNGTVGTGSVNVGTAESPSLLMSNVDLQSSASFNLQSFSNGTWESKIFGVTFAQNTIPLVTVVPPTGANTGAFVFRISSY